MKLESRFKIRTCDYFVISTLTGKVRQILPFQEIFFFCNHLPDFDIFPILAGSKKDFDNKVFYSIEITFFTVKH